MSACVLGMTLCIGRKDFEMDKKKLGIQSRKLQFQRMYYRMVSPFSISLSTVNAPRPKLISQVKAADFELNFPENKISK